MVASITFVMPSIVGAIYHDGGVTNARPDPNAVEAGRTREPDSNRSWYRYWTYTPRGLPPPPDGQSAPATSGSHTSLTVGMSGFTVEPMLSSFWTKLVTLITQSPLAAR